MSIDWQLEEELIRIESEWRKNKKVYSFYEYVEMLGEDTTIAKNGVKQQIKKAKEELQSIYDQRNHYYDTVINNAIPSEQPDLIEMMNLQFDPLVKKAEEKVKKTQYYLLYLTKKKQSNDFIGDADIQRAKSVPIVELFGSESGKCPFHNERTGSFKINKQHNFYKCFGCGEGGDSINFIMKLHNIGFIEAVKYLLKLC